MHIWDDKFGHQTFRYKKYAYVKNRIGTHVSLYGDKLKRITDWDKEQPDLVLAGNQIVSTDYQLTAKTSDFGSLIAGASITVDSVAYTVREVRKLDDGSFVEISLQKT